MSHKMIKIYLGLMICLIVTGCQQEPQPHFPSEINIHDYNGYVEFGTPIQTKGEGIQVNGNTVTIHTGGTYALTGESMDGQVIIDAGDQPVELVFAELELTCQNNSPILIRSAQAVTLTTKEDTQNKLKDTKNYLLNDIGATAVIYSQCDLTLKGKGLLEIEGRYQNGIETKGNMTIESGRYIIDAVYNGCVSFNQMVLQKADYTIQSDDTAIKGKTILVQDGTFLLESKKTAMAAESMDITQGMWTVESQENGFIAEELLTIRDGTYLFDSKKRCMEANDLAIYQGAFTLNSEEIGISVKDHFAVYGGTLRIENSQTGLLAHSLDVNDGTLNIMSTVDGLHIIEKNEQAGNLLIQNGNIIIDAGSIGLNIEGTMKMQGGTVYLNGPTHSQSQALVCSQAYEMNGGIFCSLDMSGPTQLPIPESQQAGLLITLGKSFAAGTSIMIKDNNDHNIFEYTSLKAFQTMMISTVKLSLGDTYLIYINNQLYGEITLYTAYSPIRY